MNDIKLLWKKVIWDKSPVLLKYSPGDDWKDYWDGLSVMNRVISGVFFSARIITKTML